MERKVLFLVGPTGSGKSEVALALAQKLKGEIISCDAMQVYKGMDIGTAKPTLAERRRIPHHLIDLVSPRAEHSVFKHRELVLKSMERIFSKKRLPIVVGGSGLYVKAITNGLAPQPGKRALLRQQWEASAQKKGVSSLYAQLRELDPRRAQAIHANDKRRIIRALEILKSSHRSQSDWESETQSLESLGIRPVIFGLRWDRKKLYERIEDRLDRMLKEGWIREVKRLKKVGFSKTARAAIGYCEILKYLHGECALAETETEIEKRTRHLAKKQMTWFRADKRIFWIPVSGDRFVGRAVRKIVQEFKVS